jgi:hypothetical protein
METQTPSLTCDVSAADLKKLSDAWAAGRPCEIEVTLTWRSTVAIPPPKPGAAAVGPAPR